MSDNRFSMAWAPAPNRPLPNIYTGRKNVLGQQVSGHDNKVIALAVDSLVGLGSAYLAYGLGSAGNRFSTFWWIVTGMVGVKFLHDMSRP